MFDWYPRRATEAELVVARAILEGSDRRLESLFEQFRACRRVERHRAGASMRVVVPWTVEELMVDLDEDVASDPVRVRDLRSGQMLRFRVQLARGGFFRHLEGRADMRWPRRWDVDSSELAVAASGTLRLPEAAPLDALREWLGIRIPVALDVVVRHPASRGAIVELQHREARPIPDQLTEYLEVTDGMSVDGWEILGTRDLHVVEAADNSYWQVAVRAGASDDRRCLLGANGSLVIVPTHDSQPRDFEPVGTDLRHWVIGLLGG